MLFGQMVAAGKKNGKYPEVLPHAVLPAHSRLPQSANYLFTPQIWGVGSEAEFHPLIPAASIRNYGLSKRSMMRVAKSYMARDDIMYRHIVPVTYMHDRSFIYRTPPFC